MNFYRTQIKIYSSSDWTVINFENASIAYCNGKEPEEARFRCFMDRITLNQPLGRETEVKNTLYLYDFNGNLKIRVRKGWIGVVKIVFSSKGKEVQIVNDIHRNGKNSKEFNVKIPYEAIEKEGKTHFGKLVLSFYYTWYGNPSGPAGRWIHWNSCGHNPDLGDINAAHHPILGPYDSASEYVIKKHIFWAKTSGIDGFVIPWFGENNHSYHGVLSFVKEAENQGFKFSFSFPFVDYDREVTPEVAADEISNVLQSFSSSPLFIRLEGKPAIFLYAADSFPKTFWGKVFRILKERGFYLYPFADAMGPSVIGEFRGLYFYLPIFFGDASFKTQEKYFKWAKIVSILKDMPLFLPVFPGFDKRKGCGSGKFIPRRGGKTMEALFALISSYGPDGIFASTFNEWHEGTEFEPSEEYGFYYLDLLSLLSREFKSNEKIHR